MYVTASARCAANASSFDAKPSSGMLSDTARRCVCTSAGMVCSIDVFRKVLGGCMSYSRVMLIHSSRLLFASVAPVWLLLFVVLAAVLCLVGLLRLLLSLLLRPAAASLLVSCACLLLMVRVPGGWFAVVWLLFYAWLACLGCCCACFCVLLLFRFLFHALALCLCCACLVAVARWLG